MPRLDFYTDYKKPFVKIKLGEDHLLIGRGADCTVQLPDERVSRHHARIELRDDGYWIKDLSANGTRVNFSMLDEPAPLSAGDRIYIEKYVIMYQPDDVPSAILDEEKTRI